MIRLSKSSISSAEKKAVMDVLDKAYLGMGEQVQKFEKELTEYFGRPAVCVVNGTAALHLACQSAGIKYGDEVLVQSLTYIASFQAISATGAKPVACDVDSDTLTLDWRDAEKRLTSKTKAIMPVHYAGAVGDLDAIYEFAERYNLRVIEDAAHAFGTEFKGEKVGSFGDISCFSFDGIKNITSGEGGCIVTDDCELLQKIRDARQLGVVNDTERRFSGERSWEFEVTQQGWRYHMSDIMAAIGIEQLKRFDEIKEKRQLLASHYNRLLSNYENVTLLPSEYKNVVPHIFPVIINTSVTREQCRKKLLEKNIQTGIHYYPNHNLKLYNYGNRNKIPVTEYVYPRLLTLPLHYDLSVSDVEYICESLINAL